MTLKEFELLYKSHIFHSPGFWMLDETSKRREQAELFIDEVIENPHYNYSKLTEYMHSADGFNRDIQFISEVSEALKTVDNEDFLMIQLYKEKISHVLHDRNLIKSIADLQSSNFDAAFINKYADSNLKTYGEYNQQLFNDLYSNISCYDERYYETIQNCRKLSSVRFMTLNSKIDEYGKVVFFSSDMIKSLSDRYLKDTGLSSLGWHTIESDTAIGVTISYRDRSFILPSHLQRSPARVKQLLAHEIETHIRRHSNSMQSELNLFRTGTLGGIFVEEGLGIFSEVIVGHGQLSGNSGYKRAVNRYIALGLALGADGKDRQTIRAVFNDLLLYKYGTVDVSRKRKLETFSVIENIYRGSDFLHPKALFQRAKIYLEGFMKIIDHLKYEDISVQSLDSLYLARYDFTSKNERDLLQLHSKTRLI